MIDLENYVSHIKSLYGVRPVAVFGLGASGMSVVKALREKGVDILAWDDKVEAREEAAAAGANVALLDEQNLAECAALILAPGIPLHYPAPHPVVAAARAAEIEIYGDIEIFYRNNPGRKIIGITGTNGKSTTTALIAHILNVCGRTARAGGNIGMPVLSLEPPPPEGAYVLELSSFQLDLCPTFRPDISVLLNITPDHIDRHGNLENYVSSKERIFEGPGVAIIGVDDEHSSLMRERLRKSARKTIPVSGEKAVSGGVYALEGVLYDHTDKKMEIGSLHGLTALPGAHNHQNIAAAYAACRACGLEPAEIYDALKSFPGLPHRQYPVRAINGVVYVNDSKATNADAAARALACHRNIYWILGGRRKEDGINGLERYFDRVRHAFLIGEAAEEFAKRLEQYKVPHDVSLTLEAAVARAHEKAQSERGLPGGSTVLLSPACSSYDQFKNFEERGARFAYLVESLEEAA